jgi:hypothetical protein
MPTSAGNISKGEILAKFDEYINGPNNSHEAKDRKAKATEVKSKLTRGDELISIIVNSEISLGQDQLDHLGRDWLDKALSGGAKSGWWQYLQPLDPVFRQGFIESAEAVEATGYHVDHYWVSAGHSVEMWVCQGAAQITTLIATPTPPGGLGPVTTEHDPIWIVRPISVRGGETVDGGTLQQDNCVVVIRPRRGL